MLDRKIQHTLWDMQWEELRPIQVDAIHQLLGTEDDLLLFAQTAGGKTEAAFLPILSRIISDPKPGLRAIYVGPLKALINDQFGRISELCGRTEIPVWRWHGDVGAGQKKKLIDSPSGVLLITPESLESIFVNRSTALVRLFAGLDFLVIDELHVFLDGPRGMHLRSLISRMRRIQPGFRTVGLSATIAEAADACVVMNRDAPQRVAVVSDTTGEKELRLRLHAYIGEPEEQIADSILDMTHGRSALVFANARADVENYAERVSALCRKKRLPDRVLVHHGSLSKELREDAETRMKRQSGLSIFCTSTLELGIDIGTVDLVLQFGAPWAVAGLVQRLGRGGRGEGEPRVLRCLVAIDEGSGDELYRALAPELLQTIAVIELMLEGWLERPRIHELDLSTLVQQIMSLIRQTGGVRADDAYKVLCRGGGFPQVRIDLFARVLRSLAGKDVIEQAPSGPLILGLEGERIANHYGFYSCFMTTEDFQVRHGSRTIGALSVDSIPEAEEHFILNARRWSVVSVDVERKVIAVEPARGRKKPMFLGCGGEVEHAVRLKMRDVVAGDFLPRYMDQTGIEILSRARARYRDCQASSRALVDLGGSNTAWFTWGGSRQNRTLIAMLKALGIECTDRRVYLALKAPLPTVWEALPKLANWAGPALELARGIPRTETRKYDYLLNDELLQECVAADLLDVEGARRIAAAAIELGG